MKITQLFPDVHREKLKAFLEVLRNLSDQFSKIN